MGRLSRAKLRALARSWHASLLPLLYAAWNNAGGASGILPLWLKAQVGADGLPRYGVVEINRLVMPTALAGVVGGIAAGWMSDGPLRGRRWPMILLLTLFHAALCTALLLLPVYSHLSTHFWLYYLTGLTGGLSGLFFAWANELCSSDNEERALVVVLMNDLAYVVQAVVPNFVWRTVDFPEARRGLGYSVGLSLAVTPLALVVRHLHERDKRRAGGWEGGPEGERLLAGNEVGEVGKGRDSSEEIAEQ